MQIAEILHLPFQLIQISIDDLVTANRLLQFGQYPEQPDTTCDCRVWVQSLVVLSNLGVDMGLETSKNSADVEQTDEQERFDDPYCGYVAGSPGSNAARDVVLLSPQSVVVVMIQSPMEVIVDRLVATQEKKNVNSIFLKRHGRYGYGKEPKGCKPNYVWWDLNQAVSKTCYSQKIIVGSSNSCT